MQPAKNPPLAVTMGEPSGIGGEIAMKAWHALRDGPMSFFVIDDPARLAVLSAATRLAAPVAPIDNAAQADSVFREALPVLPVGAAIDSLPGRPDAANAAMVIRSIEMAVAAVLDGKAGAVVTNPIQKSTLYDAGFPHPGHTEFLGEIAGTGQQPVMMLASPGLRVVPVTVHMSLEKAIRSLDAETIVSRARLTNETLRRDFGIKTPRLAVAGLNPHAGEDGKMGDEEDRIIRPAIERLRQEGIDAGGPYPPDTLFTARKRGTYDVAICMYHDQALIPLKALDVDGGVNVTLGLRIVRTSPDHGTALDIAGTGIADPGSMIAALRLAGQMAAMGKFEDRT